MERVVTRVVVYARPLDFFGGAFRVIPVIGPVVYWLQGQIVDVQHQVAHVYYSDGTDEQREWPLGDKGNGPVGKGKLFACKYTCKWTKVWETGTIRNPKKTSEDLDIFDEEWVANIRYAAIFPHWELIRDSDNPHANCHTYAKHLGRYAMCGKKLGLQKHVQQRPHTILPDQLIFVKSFSWARDTSSSDSFIPVDKFLKGFPSLIAAVDGDRGLREMMKDTKNFRPGFVYHKEFTTDDIKPHYPTISKSGLSIWIYVEKRGLKFKITSLDMKAHLERVVSTSPSHSSGYLASWFTISPQTTTHERNLVIPDKKMRKKALIALGGTL